MELSGADAVVFIATAWGPKHGGINALNMDLAAAMAAHVAVPVFCFAAKPTESELEHAARVKVSLLPIPVDCPDGVDPALATVIIETLRRAASEIRHPCWVGHDLISGPVMLACHDQWPGTSVLIQHMDYESYEVLKDGDGKKALSKGAQQIELVDRSMVVAGIGPKLANVARSRIERAISGQVLELIPGLPSIEIGRPPAAFSGIAFGRFDRRMEPIKQSRLAVAGFARAVRNDATAMGRDCKLTLLGLEPDRALLDELNALAFREAGRGVVINGAPFSENRDELFGLLRRHSVALMLSYHEGFGLVGWEAIAAGVPLVLSQNSGLFELLEERMLENRVSSVDVRGSANPAELNPEDITAVAERVLNIARAPRKARERAESLTRELKAIFSWRRCAVQLASAATVPVLQPRFSVLLACGHPPLDVFGPSDITTGEPTPEQREARRIWMLAAAESARCLASQNDPRWQVLFSGVDGGTFAAAVVRELVDTHRRESDVLTITHTAFGDDEQAQAFFAAEHPTHYRTHNVDPSRPYLYLPGRVSRIPGIEQRREVLVAEANAVLCVAGQGPVNHMIGLAMARKLPLILIGAFGGTTRERLDALVAHNSSLNLPRSLDVALRELAYCRLDEPTLLHAIQVAFRAFGEFLSESRHASV